MEKQNYSVAPRAGGMIWWELFFAFAEPSEAGDVRNPSDSNSGCLSELPEVADKSICLH